MSGRDPAGVAVAGAAGRLGSLILSVSRDYPDLRISAAIEAETNPLIGKVALAPEANKGREVRFSSSLSESMNDSSLFIDCASAASSVQTAAICAEMKKPVIILATGQKPEELDRIRSYGKEIPVLIAPNASIGVFVMHEVTLHAKKLLGASYDVEIAEIHHRHKKDAPSGTALSLAKTLAAERNEPVFCGRNETSGSRKPDEIGIAALRGGDVPGEHTVYFFGEGDRIEIRHSARDRSIFARGALMLAQKLRGCAPGIYGVKDLFGL